jgi:hypothetical protein
MIRLAPRLLLVALLGYLLIALLQALFLELLLGGRVAPHAAWTIQFCGIAGTVISGLTGGWIVARLGGERPWLHVAVVLVPLFLDTVFVISKNAEDHPLWFNLAGSVTLMIATLAGCWLRVRAKSAPRPGVRSPGAQRAGG